MMPDPDFPDIYTDGVSVAAGPYGLTLSFLLTDPLAQPPDLKLPGRIVGRVRMSPELAQALVKVLQRSLRNRPKPKLSFEDAESPK
jgi:hypothetical protein